MKLLHLHLSAYAHFQDCHLDFSAGQEGLHLIFGPNEAGKSSALRALRALLYGIPRDTVDDFQHKKSELRVGGRFRAANGYEFVGYRKGTRTSLFDAQDRPLTEDALTPLLGGANRPLFERMFGIDHPALVHGGKELLAEHGREAEALFSSGLGGPGLHRVLKQLDEEAENLFKPQGSKPDINVQLRQFEALQRELQAVALPARKWEELRCEVKRAQQRLLTMDMQLHAAAQRRAVLERLRRTLPGLAQRVQGLERLAQLGSGPHLAAGFTARREAAMAQRLAALEGRSKAQARWEGLRHTSANLTVADDLLAAVDSIENLREQLGSYRKANQDRPGLIGRRLALATQAQQQLAAIRPDLNWSEVSNLRPLLRKQRRATDLGGQREALVAAEYQARANQAEIARHLADKTAELERLAAPPSLIELQRAVEAARRAGDLERTLDEATRRWRSHTEISMRELASLGLWRGELAAFAQVPLPNENTLNRFTAAIRTLESERQTLEKNRSAEQIKCRQATIQLNALQSTGAVPSEAALQQVREQRDTDWNLIKCQGLQPITDHTVYPLVDTFEAGLFQADNLADRLRREAQRVHEQATLRAVIDAANQQLQVIETEWQKIAEQRAEWDLAWQQVWQPCAITPLPPADMSSWLAQALRLREKVTEGFHLYAVLEQVQAVQTVHLHDLQAALITLNAPSVTVHNTVAACLNQAEHCLRIEEATIRQRLSLETSRQELRERLVRCDLEVKRTMTARAVWQDAWVALMAELGLTAEAQPGEVSDYLQTLTEILKRMDEASDLEGRINGIDADARQFQAGAEALLKRLAPDLLHQPLEEAIVRLNARLSTLRETKTRLTELQAQTRQAEKDLRDLEAQLQGANRVLQELCQQAGVATPEQLLAVEQADQERQRLCAQLRTIECELLAGGDGYDLAALEQEAAAVDRDVLRVELATLQAQIDQELRPQREALLEQKVNAERDFAAMSGGDAASQLAEQAQQTLSCLHAQAAQYVRLKLAARVLRDEIERFRRQHRDPLLALAGRDFARLTRGAFTGIATEFNVADQSVLMGVRASGERLPVEGMSHGTRDQLYLALRLANLTHYMERAEALPFIIDDILIQFDDARSQATLETLVDFSTRCQVLIFTHHQQLLEQAIHLDGAAERVFIHTLNPAKPLKRRLL